MRKLSPEQLLPSQDFLKPHTVAFIFECIAKGELDQLPPAPIVRESPEGLIAVDGHNLIAVKMYHREDIEVHIARSADDGLPETSEANKARNKDLKEKFDFVVTERVRLQQEGINTFGDLIARYPELFP